MNANRYWGRSLYTGAFREKVRQYGIEMQVCEAGGEVVFDGHSIVIDA